jgi:protein-S-isoprenylcysteine O-methyltransferase Ste14
MNENIFRRVVQTILTLVLQSVILFISAGTYRWIWAWIFVVTGVVILVINFMVLPQEVIEERGRKKGNVKKWDKILTTISILPLLGIYIISGLDYRFNWSGDLQISINIIGIVLSFLGSMIFTWSMVSNRYFSTMVRIQEERGHQVAVEGPYKYVRHPGYVGYIIMVISTPLALASLYALIMSLMVSAIFIIRTALEDKTLSIELDGYEEYSKKVRYRLIPFIW